MSGVVNICILGAGVCTSLVCTRKKVPLSVGIMATSSLFYAGSMIEFDNLVTAQPLSKTSCGYWMIKGGVFSAGFVSGSLVSSVLCNSIKRVSVQTLQAFSRSEYRDKKGGAGSECFTTKQ